MEVLLEGPLGLALAAEHIVERRALGEITHIFTHIRLTMRVEHIRIKVPSTPVVLLFPSFSLVMLFEDSYIDN